MVEVAGLPVDEASSSSSKKGKHKKSDSGKSGLLGKMMDKITGKSPKNSPKNSPIVNRKSGSTNPNAVVVPKPTTNVISINMGVLAETSSIATGDPIFCKKCGACFSMFSQLRKTNESSEWACEFCGNASPNLMIEPEEIPKTDIVDYILQPAVVPEVADDFLVVFCLDISGSMCVTVEVPALQGEWKKLRKRRENKEVAVDSGDARNQALPGEAQNASYISRLQCMQAAVSENLYQLSVRHPARRVALITFNTDVTFYSNATDEPIVLTGDALGDEEMIKKFTGGISVDKIPPIRSNFEYLNGKLMQLVEDGSTALGPALLLASHVASKSRHSEIILCTDGLSNVGLGSLDDPKTIPDATSFYKKVGTFLSQHDGTVNIMALKDSNCMLASLVEASTATGGSVNVLHPLEWVAEVQRIAQNPTIATNVHVRLLLHPSLEVCLTTAGSKHQESNNNNNNNNNNNSSSSSSSNPKNKPCEKCGNFEIINGICHNVGNATADTDLTFEFASTNAKTPSENLPFQMHITYSRMDGTQCVRVFTQQRKITKERSKAEENCDVAVLALHSIQNSAKLALSENLNDARAKLVSAASLLQRAALSPVQKEELSAFKAQARSMDREIKLCIKDKDYLKNDAASKAMHQAQTSPLSQFLSGRRKNVERRENGVFSDGELREMYYNKRF